MSSHTTFDKNMVCIIYMGIINKTDCIRVMRLARESLLVSQFADVLQTLSIIYIRSFAYSF